MLIIKLYKALKYKEGGINMKAFHLSRSFLFSLTGSVLLLTGLGLYQTQAHGEMITSPDGNFSRHIPDQAALPQASTAHTGGISVSAGIITVDGDPQDWFDAGIAELIIDPSGDMTPPGCDMLSLRVTDDGINVYFLYEFAGPPVDHSFLLMDTDTNPGTGCPAGGIGMEYALTFAPSSGYFYIGDARDCIYGPDDFPGALIVAIGGNFIEASVPIATLEIISPALSEFDITAGNDHSDVARYVLEPHLSGLVFMPQDAPDLGYSLNEADLVYFYSFDFVQSFNITTGGWSIHMPTDWVYFDWPFYYELVPGTLWFALPPASGIGVYHFSTGQWELLPRIIP